ncbi:hypothetical protein QTP88_020179 [Uroleucon formosanum]
MLENPYNLHECICLLTNVLINTIIINILYFIITNINIITIIMTQTLYELHSFYMILMTLSKVAKIQYIHNL